MSATREFLRAGARAWVSCALVFGLAACRNEVERAAMAQSPGDGDAGAPSAGAARVPRADVTVRRLWSGSDFDFASSSPSPDGRWVTAVDWATGDLAVRDLTTGTLRPLTHKGSWAESGEYAETARFSPDGRRIVYVWFNRDTGRYEVRVMAFGVDATGLPHGSDPRVVYRSQNLFALWLRGWSPDDEILTGMYRPDRTTALGLLSLSSGEIRVLKSFDWSVAGAALSPDGRFIAYDHPAGQDAGDRDLRLLSADGTRDEPLVGGPGNDVVLGWVPADGSLLFYSRRSGSPSVWRLPMNDGRPAGAPELVKEDVPNLAPLGFAGNTFYFGVDVETEHFRVATLDLGRRRLTKLPTVFDAPHGGSDEGAIRSLAWSPDGRLVIHDAPILGGTRLYLRTARGDVLRTWDLDLEVRRRLLRWAPDGSSIFLPALDHHGRGGFYRLDMESGRLEMVRRFEPPEESGRSFSISPDGRSLYFTRVGTTEAGLDARFADIVRRDIASGAEHAIHRVSQPGPVVVSPDGAWLAYYPILADAEQTIRLFPVGGGEPRTLHRVEEGRLLGIVGWAPDAERLLFVVGPRTPDGRGVDLWTVSREGGDGERLARLEDAAIGGAALHPDGRTIAYREGQPRGEIWALDGLGGGLDVHTGGNR